MPQHFKAGLSSGFYVERNPRKALAVCSQSVACSSGAAEKCSGWFSQLIFLPGCYASQCSEGILFTLMKAKIVKCPQARSDPGNDKNLAMKDIYAKEVIVDLVTIISHLV